jgi:hypothetical protein
MDTALFPSLQPEPTAPEARFPLALRPWEVSGGGDAGGTQFLPVSGTLTDRFLVTYRGPAARLARLVPSPFEIDEYRGYGFLSVCAVEIAGMGIAGTPSFLRFENREFLYRVGVRFRGEPTFLTLRSDVSSRALSLLGRYFSHYRPHLGQVWLFRDGERLRMEGTTERGEGDGVVEVDLSAHSQEACNESVFADEATAAEFLLGMKFSADVVRGRVRVQPIDHDAWHPRFVETKVARFAFVEELERRLGTSLTLDGTLAVRNVPHVWRAARWI